MRIKRMNTHEVVITISVGDLQDLCEVLASAGNSTCRYRNNFPTDSLRYGIELRKAEAAWEWSDKLAAPPFVADEEG